MAAARAQRAAGAGRWRIERRQVWLDAAARRLLDCPTARTPLDRWLAGLAPADAAHLARALDAGDAVSFAHGGAWFAGNAGEGRAEGLVLPRPAPAAPGRDEFFAGVSHELRTPLNAILGFARLAQAELADHPAGRHVEHIESSSRLMLRVVNDLLDLAQLEAGRLEIAHDEPLHLPALVAGVGRVAASLRQDKPIALYAFADPACPARLRGDAGRLEQVLLNLVGNALKYTARGLVVLAVKPVARGDGQVTLRFSVSDTGSGIALDRLPHIGRPFERAEPAALPQAGGTGLGLTVVRRLLELHGTALQLASVDGGGTLAWFDLTLPLDTAAPPDPRHAEWALLTADRRFAHSVATQWRMHGQALASGADARRWIVDVAAPDAAARAAALQAAGCEVVRASAPPAADGAQPLVLLADAVFRPARSAPPAEDPRLAGLRVLVLEDNPLNQQVLGALLVRSGVVPVIEAEGAGALARAGREHFDAALLDIQLPGESGIDIARRLRARPGGDALPIVFLSAHLGTAEQLAARELGALGCLMKPYEPADLLALLRRVPRAAAREPAPPAPPVLPIAPADLRRLFRDTWPGQRALIRGDGETLRRGVHSLRGSLALLGEREALALARQIEEGLLAGQPAASLPVAALLARADAIAAG